MVSTKFCRVGSVRGVRGGDNSLPTIELYYYLRQVDEVNGGDNAFVRCVSVCLSVCLSVCVCAAAGQWELNANSSKTLRT